AAGYGKAIEEFDKRLPEILKAMGEEDILILCSDHGNDPAHSGWDHTREYILGIAAGKAVKSGTDLGTRASFADIGATITDILTGGRRKTSIGESFKDIIIEEV
ncbi:MAG: phosphopentomutase, partial [Firmicutes bacterium]|nr:phosphopentomutase [Bacillota bacterium]